jgi:hypothetical protein
MNTRVDPSALRALAGDFQQAAAQVPGESAGFESTTSMQPSDCGAPPVGPALYARYQHQRADARDGLDHLHQELLGFSDRLAASAANYEGADAAGPI